MNEELIKFVNVDEKSGEIKTELIFQLGNLEVMDAFDREISVDWMTRGSRETKSEVEFSEYREVF